MKPDIHIYAEEPHFGEVVYGIVRDSLAYMRLIADHLLEDGRTIQLETG